MRIWRFTFIVLLNTAFLPVADSEQPRDYYSQENVGKFADFLFEQGDYLRAAGEYQRFLFFSPGRASEFTIRLLSVTAWAVNPKKQYWHLRRFYS
jgi:hypothetical protein